MTMILATKPPNYEEIKTKFNLDEKEVIFFTYGDTIYSPSGVQPTMDLIMHEQKHIDQQKGNNTVAKLWWQRYLEDPEWRIQQEAEAYGAQFRYICETHKDKNYQIRYLYEIGKHLSSSIYGNSIKHSQAMKLIRACSTKKVVL